jgi:hypothetical protein
MTQTESHDQTRVWAYGIVEPGWYCARSIWDHEYARHLESLGYRVLRSIKSPAIAEKAGL